MTYQTSNFIINYQSVSITIMFKSILIHNNGHHLQYTEKENSPFTGTLTSCRLNKLVFLYIHLGNF